MLVEVTVLVQKEVDGDDLSFLDTDLSWLRDHGIEPSVLTEEDMDAMEAEMPIEHIELPFLLPLAHVSAITPIETGLIGIVLFGSTGLMYARADYTFIKTLWEKERGPVVVVPRHEPPVH